MVGLLYYEDCFRRARKCPAAPLRTLILRDRADPQLKKEPAGIPFAVRLFFGLRHDVRQVTQGQRPSSLHIWPVWQPAFMIASTTNGRSQRYTRTANFYLRLGNDTQTAIFGAPVISLWPRDGVRSHAYPPSPVTPLPRPERSTIGPFATFVPA